MKVPSLATTAGSAFATADSVWSTMEAECQTQASAVPGDRDVFLAELEESMPITVDKVSEETGEVHTTDAHGTIRTQRFSLHDGQWQLTCEGMQLEPSTGTADEAPDDDGESIDGAVDDSYDPHLAFSCPPEGNTLYEPGTALYDDGTTGYEAECDVPGGYNPHGAQSRSSDGTADSYMGDDGLQHWNGEGDYEDWADQRSDRPGGAWGRVGAERCGTACGDSPTSGEIQLKNGCEAGYIDDPELCATVDW